MKKDKKYTEAEIAAWNARMNPRLPDWISISNLKIVSLKGKSPEEVAAHFGLPSLDGIPMAIDDSIPADPGFILRYLD